MVGRGEQRTTSSTGSVLHRQNEGRRLTAGWKGLDFFCFETPVLSPLLPSFHFVGGVVGGGCGRCRGSVFVVYAVFAPKNLEEFPVPSLSFGKREKKTASHGQKSKSAFSSSLCTFAR